MAEYKICEICGLKSDCLVTQKSQGNTCGSVNALFGARIGETEQAFWICNTGHIDGCDKPIRHFSLMKVDRQWNGTTKVALPTNKEDICFMEIQELYDQRTEKPQTWGQAREEEVQYTCNAFMMWMFTAEELDAIDEGITAADLADKKMQTPKVIPYKVRRWMVVYALKGGADCLKDYNTYQFVFRTRAKQRILNQENEYVFGKYLYRNNVWPSKDNFWGPRDFRSLFSGAKTDLSGSTPNQWSSQRVLAGASSIESFDKNSRILQTESGNVDNIYKIGVNSIAITDVEKCRAPKLIMEPILVGKNVRKILRMTNKRYMAIQLHQKLSADTKKVTIHLQEWRLQWRNFWRASDRITFDISEAMWAEIASGQSVDFSDYKITLKRIEGNKYEWINFALSVWARVDERKFNELKAEVFNRKDIDIALINRMLVEDLNKAADLKAAYLLAFEAQNAKCTAMVEAHQNALNKADHSEYPDIDQDPTVMEKLAKKDECLKKLQEMSANYGWFEAKLQDITAAAEAAKAKATKEAEEAEQIAKDQAKLDAEKRNQEAEALRLQESFEIENGIKIIDEAKKAAEIEKARLEAEKMELNGVTQAGMENMCGEGCKIDPAPTFDLSSLGRDLDAWKPLIIGKLRCKDKYNLGVTDQEIQDLLPRQAIFHMDGRLYCNGRLPQNVPADDTSCDCDPSNQFVLLILFQKKPADKAFEMVNLHVDHFNPKVRDFMITLVIPFAGYNPVKVAPAPRLPHVRSCEHDIHWWRGTRVERALATARFFAFTQGEIEFALHTPADDEYDMGMHAICHDNSGANTNVALIQPEIVIDFTTGPGANQDCNCYLPKRYRTTSATCVEHFDSNNSIGPYFREQEELRTALKCYQADLFTELNNWNTSQADAVDSDYQVTDDSDPLDWIKHMILKSENVLALGPGSFYYELLELWAECRLTSGHAKPACGETETMHMTWIRHNNIYRSKSGEDQKAYFAIVAEALRPIIEARNEIKSKIDAMRAAVGDGWGYRSILNNLIGNQSEFKPVPVIISMIGKIRGWVKDDCKSAFPDALLSVDSLAAYTETLEWGLAKYNAIANGSEDYPLKRETTANPGGSQEDLGDSEATRYTGSMGVGQEQWECACPGAGKNGTSFTVNEFFDNGEPACYGGKAFRRSRFPTADSDPVFSSAFCTSPSPKIVAGNIVRLSNMCQQAVHNKITGHVNAMKPLVGHARRS
jgi:hypothetical protein